MLFIKYSSPCSNVAYLKELGHTIQSKIPPNNITKLIEDGYTVKVRCFETGYINDGGLIRENITKDGFINYVKGANIGGFIKVADAMMAQGVV